MILSPIFRVVTWWLFNQSNVNFWPFFRPPPYKKIAKKFNLFLYFYSTLLVTVTFEWPNCCHHMTISCSLKIRERITFWPKCSYPYSTEVKVLIANVLEKQWILVGRRNCQSPSYSACSDWKLLTRLKRTDSDFFEYSMNVKTSWNANPNALFEIAVSVD
jgi:hypothetical protein